MSWKDILKYYPREDPEGKDEKLARMNAFVKTKYNSYEELADAAREKLAQFSDNYVTALMELQKEGEPFVMDPRPETHMKVMMKMTKMRGAGSLMQGNGLAGQQAEIRVALGLSPRGNLY